MRPTVNSDESVTAHRSAHVGRYTNHLSRRPKEQISGSKNAQTEYETHLSQNAAHSSTYGPDNRSVATSSEKHINSALIDQKDALNTPENLERKHKGVGTRDDDDSLHRYQSCCAVLQLWCVKLCTRKKEYTEHVLSEPTKRLFERIKRSKKCGKPDETVAGVSTAPYQESMDHRSARKKSRRSRKQDEEAEAYDKDAPVEIRDERKKRKERRKREKKERETEERRERHRREEKLLHPVDVRWMTRDDDLVSERQPSPFSVTDFAKSCCYLCAQNTLAIAAAASKPEQSDKCVQVSVHKFHAETPLTHDRSCSPILLLMRTVQSSVKVRTRETSTLCLGVSNKEIETLETKKRKKFSLLPRLTRTKCPAGRHAACEIDKTPLAARYDGVEKRERRIKKCCKEKA